MTNSPWALLFKVNNGHKFFRHDDGRYALADDSGATPPLSDGGPCYLQTHKPIEVYMSHTGFLMCNIPVDAHFWGSGHASTPAEFLLYKDKYWPSWMVKASPILVDMLNVLRKANLI